MKLNKEFIQQLRNGEIAVENNGDLKKLREVLKAAFPEDSVIPLGNDIYYSRSESWIDGWKGFSFKDKSRPTFKISDFYQPELFTGWAKDDSEPKWMAYFKEDIPLYGFNVYGKFEDDYNNSGKYSSDVDNRPATHEEIEQGLTKEAKRRGYKGGNTIKGIHGTFHFPEEISFRYEMETNRLVTNDYCVVFENGQWAEIIEQPKAKPKTNPATVKKMMAEIEEKNSSAVIVEAKRILLEQFFDKLIIVKKPIKSVLDSL